MADMGSAQPDPYMDTEETDLESMLLAQRKDFWRLFDQAHKEGEKKGFTKLEDLPD